MFWKFYFNFKINLNEKKMCSTITINLHSRKFNIEHLLLNSYTIQSNSIGHVIFCEVL